jgi:acyl dehydratase
MPVRSDALGALLPPRTIDITPRVILAFAAGIGETGPATFDDTASHFIAPRSLCAMLEWPVVSGPDRPARLGLTESELRMGVHVEQDSQFHRAIRAGDRLTTRGTLIAIQSTSAGALVQYKLETIDAANNPVVTTYSSSIIRGVAVSGEGGRLEPAPAFPKSDDSFPQSITIRIPREAAHVYTECSAIWNPIHTERAVALAAGLPDIILHGTATWAIAGRELVRIYAAQNPARLRRLRGRFQAPVIPGTHIELQHRAQGNEIHFQVLTSEGKIAIAQGFAEIEGDN